VEDLLPTHASEKPKAAAETPSTSVDTHRQTVARYDSSVSLLPLAGWFSPGNTRTTHVTSLPSTMSTLRGSSPN